ncbi:hypothetical protein [Cohaesibacter celericrescens]|nr:hypothetical protein [Cohaesibacter celericrescens]
MSFRLSKPAREEALRYAASLRFLPEALFALAGSSACLLTLFLIAGAI